MRLFNYMVSSEADRDKWLNSFSITSGLRYFGGKAFIGKYLMNHICNMACRMYKNGHGPNVFIDAFTGGGKIGLSIPEGWFDTIVMNDLNYGVYSFLVSCKNNPTALVKMIEFMGQDYCEEMFHFFTLNRSNGNQQKKALDEANDIINQVISEDALDDEKEADTRKKNFYEKHLDIISNEKLDELTAGAMTYWVTQTTWNGDTEPSTVTYRYKMADNKADGLSLTQEREKIAQAVRYAQTHVFKVHEIMKRKNIIVENLDYRELIKKYNGKSYKTIDNVEHEPEEAWENILWYFDPPYHPATLHGGNSAPYEDTFSREMSIKMTEILANKHSGEYGELSYFIKSDYDPKDCLDKFKQALKDAEKKKKDKDESRKNKGDKNDHDQYIKRLEKQIKACEDAYDDFTMIEQGEFKKVKVGSFDKGGMGADNVKTQGTEFIWYRG